MFHDSWFINYKLQNSQTLLWYILVLWVMYDLWLIPIAYDSWLLDFKKTIYTVVPWYQYHSQFVDVLFLLHMSQTPRWCCKNISSTLHIFSQLRLWQQSSCSTTTRTLNRKCSEIFLPCQPSSALDRDALGLVRPFARCCCNRAMVVTTKVR